MKYIKYAGPDFLGSTSTVLIPGDPTKIGQGIEAQVVDIDLPTIPEEVQEVAAVTKLSLLPFIGLMKFPAVSAHCEEINETFVRVEDIWIPLSGVATFN